jgi:hypothetical protein
VATSSCLLIATGDELIALDLPETTGDRTASAHQTETNEPSAAKADP